MKCADWIIDLGPGGGKKGGEVCYEGPPEKIKDSKNSVTAEYLFKKL